jgi:membrane protease subunit HflC
MSNLTSAGLIALAAVAIGAWSSMFVVDEREKVLVQRFGEVNRIVEEPGLYFKIPFADAVVPIEDRVFIWNSNNMTVQVSDKQRYLVDTVTMARISNAQKFRETVGANLDLAEARIRTRLDAALRQTYGKRTFNAALSKDRAVMMQEIRELVRNEAENLGIRLVDVRIRRTDLMKEVLDATYQRMQSERLAEAKDLRGKGEATKIQMMASADRQAVEMVSKANRAAQTIRGEGDADANRLYAEAYNQDPEFFSFYRSLQAYSTSLANNGTTMVLNPNSEFFRYLKTAPVPAAPLPSSAAGTASTQ